MYDVAVDDNLGANFWTSVKKKLKFAKEKIKLDIDPRKWREKYAHDAAGLQKNIDAIVSPDAKKHARQLVTLAKKAEQEKEATHSDELAIEKARSQQKVQSVAVISGLGLGAVILYFALRRK